VQPAYYVEFAAGARVRKYRQVAAVLFEHFPHASLMTSEIGGLGYAFRGQVVDAAGLVSPAALRYHPLQTPQERSAEWLGAVPVGFVAEVRPGIIVSYAVLIEALLQSDVLHDYVHIREPVYLAEDVQRAGSAEFWGSEHLHIFIRKDLLPPQAEQVVDDDEE
jgi:hypothetical protein